MDHIETLVARIYSAETPQESADISNALDKAAQEIRKLRLECPYAELHDHLLYWEDYANKMSGEAASFVDTLEQEEAEIAKYGSYQQQNSYRSL
jgi:hypothetical protein